MKSQDETLEEWCRLLLRAFELEDVDVDINEVLSVAGVAAHSVVRPAAPLTTFIAGLATGLTCAAGQAPDADAMKSAMDVARAVAKSYAADEARATAGSPAAGSAGTEPAETSVPSGTPGE
ncbi:DUF6457 domain-containing protein [Arthrobacter sp. NPDC058097]|uniref:DUF6457 domain-containing protein n=1 Tax=Arthrobacter sp. NPDC058097 TaxID=3346340 RepID=UPI0036D92A54